MCSFVFSVHTAGTLVQATITFQLNNCNNFELVSQSLILHPTLVLKILYCSYYFSGLCIQADLRDTAGSVPDHHIKASMAIKPIIIFLLVEGLAFNL